VADLPADIDLYADEVDCFWAKLKGGDDFAHWSVWYGCVLFDSGVMREAAEYVGERGAWPDLERKLRQARSALDFAEQMVDSGTTPQPWGRCAEPSLSSRGGCCSSPGARRAGGTGAVA